MSLQMKDLDPALRPLIEIIENAEGEILVDLKLSQVDRVIAALNRELQTISSAHDQLRRLHTCRESLESLLKIFPEWNLLLASRTDEECPLPTYQLAKRKRIDYLKEYLNHEISQLEEQLRKEKSVWRNPDFSELIIQGRSIIPKSDAQEVLRYLYNHEQYKNGQSFNGTDVLEEALEDDFTCRNWYDFWRDTKRDSTYHMIESNVFIDRISDPTLKTGYYRVNLRDYPPIS